MGSHIDYATKYALDCRRTGGDAMTRAKNPELHACWAALVAYVEDIHQPQDNLDEQQWAAAERLLKVLNVAELATVEDRILFDALGAMLDQFDPPDMGEDDWVTAERMLAEYAAAVEQEGMTR